MSPSAKPASEDPCSSHSSHMIPQYLGVRGRKTKKTVEVDSEVGLQCWPEQFIRKKCLFKSRETGFKHQPVVGITSQLRSAGKPHGFGKKRHLMPMQDEVANLQSSL